MKKGYVRIPTAGPMPTWEKVMMWLLSILMAVICIGTSISLTRANTWNWHSYAFVGLLGVMSLFIAVWLSSDSNHAKTVLSATVSLVFYGLCVWFGGLPGRTSMGILFALGCTLVVLLLWSCKPKESRILGIIESSTGEYVVISLACWIVWLVPFFLTRQHWWKYVWYGVGGLVGLAVLVAIGYALGTYFPFHACGRFIARVWQSCIIKPAKFVYTVLVGHPRYWYKVDDHLEYTESSSKMNKAAFQPAYVYLPLGGIFRKCRMVWPGNHWSFERKRLGLRGYRLVDHEGAALAIHPCRLAISRASIDFGPGWCILNSRLALVFDHGNRELDIEAKEADKRILQIFDQKSVTCVLDGLYRESASLKDKVSRLEFSDSAAKKEQLEQLAKLDAEKVVLRQELAKRLARITALVKAAPKHKKLGTARHELTAMVQELVGDEKQAKALLLDALDALEQAESGPAQN